MKKFLILSLAAFAVMIVGIVGYSVSAAPGYSGKTDIFYGLKYSEQGYFRTYEVMDGGITKLFIDASDADVYIISASEKNKVELYNFPDYSYAYSNNNNTVSFDNADSKLDAWTVIFDYAGFREYVNYASFQGKRKMIRIYLADKETVDTVDIKVVSGTLYIDGEAAPSPFCASFEKGELKSK